MLARTLEINFRTNEQRNVTFTIKHKLLPSNSFVSCLKDIYCLLFCDNEKKMLLKSSLVSCIYFNFPHQISLIELVTKGKDACFLHDIEILVIIMHQSGFWRYLYFILMSNQFTLLNEMFWG